MSDAKSGSLSPPDATKETYKVGLKHLHDPLIITFLKSLYGGMLLSAAGLVSLTIVGGNPDISPGMERLLLGLTFPVGLVIIYFVGAELYTGYPMWFAITALERQGTVWLHFSRMVVSWVGDLCGCFIFAYFFTYQSQTLSEEPFRSGVIDLVKNDVLEPDWHVIFLRSIPSGFLVTVAMFLGSQNHDGISKALGLHLPFFLAVVSRAPHTVEYMYVTAVGKFLGSPVTWGQYFGKALIPITLGNTIGGSLFTGAYTWFIFIECERRGWSAEVKDDAAEAGPLRL